MTIGAAEFGTGGYYELVIDLGRPDARVDEAVEALWRHPDLEAADGLAANDDDGAAPAARGPAWRHGVARLPNGASVPCRSFAEVIADRKGETAYVVFAIPMSTLERAFGQGRSGPPHPSPASLDRTRREEIDTWLAAFGAAVDTQVPFKAAYIGFLPFPIGEDEMAEVLFERDVPEERCLAYLYRRDGELRYFPANLWS